MLHLEVRRAAQQRLEEARLLVLLRCRGGGQHFVAGAEHVGDGLVAVHIDEEVAARGLDGGAHLQHFRAARLRRVHPFPIEVGAGGVHAQVAAHAAIRVHVGHHVEIRALQQGLRNRVGSVEQVLAKAKSLQESAA